MEPYFIYTKYTGPFQEYLNRNKTPTRQNPYLKRLAPKQASRRETKIAGRILDN